MVLSCYIKSFDYTDFISKMQQNAPYCVLLKKKFWGGGKSRPPYRFQSLEGWHVWKIQTISLYFYLHMKLEAILWQSYLHVRMEAISWYTSDHLSLASLSFSVYMQAASIWRPPRPQNQKALWSVKQNENINLYLLIKTFHLLTNRAKHGLLYK